jgi:uracil-DNA glycosylase family 4
MKWIPKNPNNICLVGEAPGEQEVKQGIPFVGPEGRYLTKLLEVAGIKKADCFITNVAHEKPRKNVFETLPAQVIADGKRQLKEDIERWQPNVVIACGAKALEALALQGSIYKYRGAVMESTMVPGQKMIATLHPGALIKGQPKYEPIVIADLAKANEESSSPDIHYPRRDIDIIRDIKDAVATLEFYTSYPYKLACDIESIGTSGIMTAFGIADSKDHAISITKECLESPQVLRALSKFCDSSAPKIYHNALFDALHNGIYYNIYNRNIVDDTMIKQHAIMPILEKSLGFCASIYTNEVYWKDEGKDFFTELKKNRNADWDQLYRYNGMDCCLTYEINEAQEEQLDYWGTREIYEMMKRLIYPCLRAMYTGFRVDHKKVEAFKVENEKAIENLFKIADKTLGGINVRSTPQKKQLLYEEWKLPKQYNKGKVSTSRQCIEKLERFPTPYKAHLGLMRNMSDYLKRRDFYRLNLDKDDRIRYSLKITGTYTGRMASSKSITGSGSNYQNQPKKVRSFYPAEPGNIFIQMDLSQAEARVVAALCKDEKWLQEFDKEDLHTKVASMLYGISPEKVRKAVERQTAKRVAHASHYLLGWSLLSNILKCSAKEAKAHKKTYYEIRPNLDGWHGRVRKQIRDTKKIVTPFGRMIQFPGPINDKVIRDAVAAEPQSTSADYLNRAIDKMYYEGPEEFQFNLQVHDSILFQVPNELSCIQRNIEALKEITEIEIDVHGVPLVIPCDFEIGFDWYNLTEIKDISPKSVEKVYEEVCNIQTS